MEAMIDHTIYPQNILLEINISQKDSIMDYLKNIWYEVSNGVMRIGFIPQEVDDVRRMEQYVEQVGNNFR